MAASAAGPLVFMYSGQGAQYYQMGRALFEGDPAYRDALLRAERLCGPIEGRTVSDILFSRPLGESEGFDRLAETHPVLLAIAWALTQALAARGLRPDRVLGYSLGETAAAVVTGALSLDQAFWALRAQAALYERVAPSGRLVAVLCRRDRLDQASEWAGRVHLAAVNGPGHVVVALAEADLRPFLAWLEERRLVFVVLPVRFGFHSPLIEAVRPGFMDIARQLGFGRPRIPMLSCALAGPVETLDAAHFWGVNRGMVRFADTVCDLVADPRAVLIDVGPSGTLAGFIRMAGGARARVLPLINQFGRDIQTFDHVVESIR
jgi:bacillaene synthase trans-acting acyltransferase/trans-AT polyketide synthase/acyltransferase/oxidoreductase domain-containing protein